jgi:hypothetical protein
LRSVRMNVSRLVCLVACVASAPAFAQDLSRPACAHFNPYQMTDAQIAACVGPVSGPHSLPVTNPQVTGNDPDWRGTPVKVQAWANVLVGLPGLENDYDAYLTLENDTEVNVAVVIVRGAAGGTITRLVRLKPEQRLVTKLNEWSELAGQLPIGLSVRVRWMKDGNAGIAMHRARDFGSMVQAVEGGGAK